MFHVFMFFFHMFRGGWKGGWWLGVAADLVVPVLAVATSKGSGL